MVAKKYYYSEMVKKHIINVADGSELGHICDIIFSSCGRVLGFQITGKRSFFKSFSSEAIFISWNNIIKIGEDVVLVELCGRQTSALSHDDEIPSKESSDDKFF